MNLRRADCGHYIPADLAPAGVHVGNEEPVYLCNECAERARGHVARVEKKAVELAQPVPLAIEAEAYELGRTAGAYGLPEDSNPYPDRRTKDAKEWVRGYREAKSGTTAEDSGRGREAPA